MQPKELRRRVRAAVAELRRRDAGLLYRSVAERSIVSKLGCYLAKRFRATTSMWSTTGTG